MTALTAPSHGGRARRLLTLLLLLFAPFALGAQPAAAEDTPPIILGGTISPSSLPSDGGSVDITAHVIDDTPPLFMAYATIYGPEGAPQTQLLYSGPDQYTGQFYVPQNFGNEPVVYSVEVQATDNNGGFDTKLIGDITVAGVPPFDTPPVLSDPLVDPRVVPATAGNLKVGVTASDDRNVSLVQATITRPDGSIFAYLDLNQTASFNRYEGLLDVPDNTLPTSFSYHVEITATDDIGQLTTIDAGDFTVAAAPPPGTGKLTLTPTWALLGPVRRGSASRGTFAVRNTGAAGSGTVDALAVAAGNGFSIVGAPTGQQLHLAPGQSANVVVEFKPTRAGVFNGRLTVSRPDGRQRSLVATLTGIGY